MLTHARQAPAFGRPVVVFGSFCEYDWHTLRQRQHNIVDWFSESNDVVYVERMGATVPSPARLAAAVGKRLRQHPQGGELAEATSSERRIRFLRPPIVPLHGVGWADRMNARSVLGAIAGAIEPARLAECVAVACYPSPYVEASLRVGGFGVVVSDAAHRYGLVPEIYGSRAAEVDEAIARLADIRTCDSSALVIDRRTQGLDCLRLPQGLDTPFLADDEPLHGDNPVVGELAALAAEGPVCGFVGAVSDVIDARLVNAVAETGVTTVIVGPVHGYPQGRFSERVRMLGGVPGTVVASVMRLLDVGIIPYPLTERTEAVLPTKLVEYAASGSRIVSTSLPDVCEFSAAYPGVVSLADAPAAFVEAVQGALAMGRLGPDVVAQVRSRYAWPAVLEPLGDALVEACGAKGFAL